MIMIFVWFANTPAKEAGYPVHATTAAPIVAVILALTTPAAAAPPATTTTTMGGAPGRPSPPPPDRGARPRSPRAPRPPPTSPPPAPPPGPAARAISRRAPSPPPPTPPRGPRPSPLPGARGPGPGLRTPGGAQNRSASHYADACTASARGLPRKSEATPPAETRRQSRGPGRRKIRSAGALESRRRRPGRESGRQPPVHGPGRLHKRPQSARIAG